MARLSAAAYAALATEAGNPASRGIDALSASGIVGRICREDAKVAAAVRRQAKPIASAVEIIAASLAAGGRLVFIGAGTSGRLGVLEAAECPPTFGTPGSLIEGVMAGGRSAVFRSKEGAEDDEADGARQARRRLRRGDVLVGIAASGVTPFVRGALAAARGRGAKTILLTSNPKAKAAGTAVTIAPAVGPEIVAGSTRLKAATAAKLVLNALTTGAMIRLGKVYDQYMVDVRPSSYKLERRAQRMLELLGGVPSAQSAAALKRAGGSVKTAVVMARCRLSAVQARRKLALARGNLRKALGAR